MTAWQNADTSARLRGCETHLLVSVADDGKTDGRRTGLIVPRESNLPGAVKYQLLSQARRRAQETARRVLVDVETWGHARHFPRRRSRRRQSMGSSSGRSRSSATP